MCCLLSPLLPREERGEGVEGRTCSGVSCIDRVLFLFCFVLVNILLCISIKQRTIKLMVLPSVVRKKQYIVTVSKPGYKGFAFIL